MNLSLCMLVNFGFHSSILLIFFVHGVFFTSLLSWKAVKQNDRASPWLTGFTFICTLNILPWMLGHAGWYFRQPYRDILFYFPCQNFLLLGPFIFFYTKQLLNPGFRFRRQHLLHFIPATLYIAYSALMFVVDKLVLERSFFYADGRDRDLDNWYRILGIVSLSTYLVFSLRYYTLYKRIAAQLVSFADTLLFRWIRRYLAALLLMQAFDLLFFCLYPSWGSFPAKWWYYLIFSILFYYVAFMGYTQAIRPLFSFRLMAKPGQILLLSSSPILLGQQHRYLPNNEDEQVIETFANEQQAPSSLEHELLPLKSQLLEALEKEEWFCEPELTLTVVAKRLQTNVSILSKVVNKGTGMSFNDLINSYRVEAVKKELASAAHQKQTLFGVALDCGFNSKTTFNRVFKKHTGLSPKEFVQRLEIHSEISSTPEKNVSPYHDLERPAANDSPNSPQMMTP